MKLTTATILAGALLASPACKKTSNAKVVEPGEPTGSSDRSDRDDERGTDEEAWALDRRGEFAETP
jgi:hypothetical protein